MSIFVKPQMTAERSEFYQRAAKKGLTPLWTVLGELLPPEPQPFCVPVVWHYDEIRPFVMESGKLISAEEAERYGLVNRVVPRADLADAARAMADTVALVPALTAEMVKESINHMVDGMGQRESWRYHFMLHQFVSNTPTALAKVEARKQGGMDAVKREQGTTARRPQAER